MLKAVSHTRVPYIKYKILYHTTDSKRRLALKIDPDFISVSRKIELQCGIKILKENHQYFWYIASLLKIHRWLKEITFNVWYSSLLQYTNIHIYVLIVYFVSSAFVNSILFSVTFVIWNTFNFSSFLTYIQKKDLIESEKIICLKDFL